MLNALRAKSRKSTNTNHARLLRIQQWERYYQSLGAKCNVRTKSGMGALSRKAVKHENR